jgi:hypothetical protein
MKLICNQCQSIISPKNTNVPDGVCFCEKCGEFFRIASFLLFGDVIERIERPDYSNVEMVASPNAIGFVLPPLGWKGRTINFLAGTLFGNAMIWFLSFDFVNEAGGIMTLLILPFILAGVGLVLTFLFHLKGNVTLLINHSQVSVSWGLFGFEYAKKGKTLDITDIGVDVVYSQSYQPVYGVGIKFKDDKYIKFGSTLSDQEKKWIVGEIRAFLKNQ